MPSSAWAERYRDQGLVVVGVHTPEFDFEHDLDNVRRAVTDLGVDYPVVVDNDYGIWSAFDNHQRLLTDAGATGVAQELVSVDAGGVEAAADWDSLWSRRTTSATSAARASRLPTGRSWTPGMAMWSRRGCG